MTKKKLAERKERVKKMIRELKKLYPDAGIELKFKNTWQMVVAVILSAQTTDKKVNEVTPGLFKKYPSIKAFAKTTPKKLEKDINQIGLYKAKAKNIVKLANILIDKYNGKIPDTMDELIELPGIGRKTANVILNEAYDKQEGITVDTHVRRLAIRFDLTDSTHPEKIEKDLMEIVPKKEWGTFSHQLIKYGRHLCPARPHDCKDHPLTKIYPKANNVWPRAK